MNVKFRLIEMKSFGEVFPKEGSNPRLPYEHQKKAFECLDKINRLPSYSTLMVLPTGGGKTYTASMWLLKNALNKNKKILWLAHRQLLLEQAAESFQKFAYQELIPNISSFKFRIVSGSSHHDRAVNIQPSDNLLLISKDSIGKNIQYLDKWLRDEQELYVIVDEAHHSTAKTYRKVINYVKGKIPNVKLIGLTATPFRTAEQEQGLLAKIYSDGIRGNQQVVSGDIGISYQIGLKELINRRILSTPIFESYQTNETYGENIGLDALQSMENFDILPDDIAKEIAQSTARNKLIVETYLKNRQKYKQTIVFAVSVIHAIALAKLFKKAGVKCDYIVSNIKDNITGVTISAEDNEKKIKAYRNKELEVLINVNILTEGVDLPQTQTVFLARPTISSTLMTQMVGRALRGPSAGGTAQAYIVSFVDHWDDKIAWVNPESLFGETNDFIENETDRIKREIRSIGIAKIEEFASILDDTVDTAELEKVPFTQRIPVGMYAFVCLQENGVDHSYQVMVYDSTAEAYKELIEALPDLFDSFNVKDEFLSDEMLSSMETQCRDTFFCGKMIPPYETRDIINILKYYAQYDSPPKFYTFENIDRSKLDVAQIAKHLSDMTGREQKDYINSIWDSADDNLLRLFFTNKHYFIRQIDIERIKINFPEIYKDCNNVVFRREKLINLTLYEIRKYDPDFEKELRDGAFQKSLNSEGKYECAICKKAYRSRAYFQVDHIIPMNHGGKSVPENLQILCKSCNGKKGDKIC